MTPHPPANSPADTPTCRPIDQSADTRNDNADRATIRETLAIHRRVVNRAEGVRSVLLAAAIAGALTCIAAGAFAASGNGVPFQIYLVAAPLMLVLSAALWTIARRDESEIAAAIDDRFGLRDGVRTAYAFERAGTTDGFSTLQAGWTRSRMQGLDPDALVPALGKRRIAAAVVFPLLAALLGFAPESESVLAERAERARVVALAQDLNEGIEDLVEETIASAEDEEEADLLEPAELRELVEKLEVTPEKADLLRQYAEMEQDLSRRAAEMETPGLERLLDEAAAQLAQAPETARLGEALEQRRLDDAADELEGFKLSDEVNAEKLQAKRQEIDKLKSLAKRLAEAARKRDAQRAGNPSSERRDAANSTSASNANATGRKQQGDAADGSGQSGASASSDAQIDDDAMDADSESSLAQEIQELEEAVEEAEESLGECQSGTCTPSDLDKLSRSTQRANRSLSRMSKSLRRSGKKQSTQSKLRSMSQKLSQCQSCVAGQCSNPFAGGLNPGAGSAESDRVGNEREDGQQTDIAAAEKAAGPALTTIEEASSGDGVSSRRGSATRESFDRQFESFIERADVPAEVKEGVKVYLENIHKTADPDDESESQN